MFSFEEGVFVYTTCVMDKMSPEVLRNLSHVTSAMQENNIKITGKTSKFIFRSEQK